MYFRALHKDVAKPRTNRHVRGASVCGRSSLIAGRRSISSLDLDDEDDSSVLWEVLDPPRSGNLSMAIVPVGRTWVHVAPPLAYDEQHQMYCCSNPGRRSNIHGLDDRVKSWHSRRIISHYASTFNYVSHMLSDS